MKRKVFVNMLIRWEQEEKIERVLWMSYADNLAFLIDINANTYRPLLKEISELERCMENGSAEKIDKDPWFLFHREEEIKEKYRQIRYKAWEVVSYILSDCGEPAIYYPSERYQCIKETSIKFGISERTIYIYLKKYWQRGMTKNALLPDYHECGGKGKEKHAGNVKRGRPRKNTTGGINVDDKTKRIFRLAIKKYYLTTKENSLQTAYELMRKEYYSNGFKNDNGVMKPTLLDSTKNTPTYAQFRYWFQKKRNYKNEVASRKSLKRFFLENREVLGSTAQDNWGAGSVYQIDATIGNIYLVSRYNRNEVVGRPTVYTVVDAYSHMIVGVLVTLDAPSWSSSMLAILNATMDKKEFCSQYGINIEEEEWPISGCIPESILADRGEWEGTNAEGIIEGLGIKISNTASHRGDSKGLIERLFRTLDSIIRPHTPGVVGGDYQMRGGVDYRLCARLSIYEYTSILIKCVLFLNNSYMDGYQRENMMIEDYIQPIPLHIWKYSIESKSGRLRSVSQELIRLALLPRDSALVTGRGIKFKGIHYSNATAIREHWFVKAKNNGSWSVNIAYDPLNMDSIFLLNEDGKNYEICCLLKREDRYKNRTLQEIEYLLEYEKKKSQEHQDIKLQAKSDLIADIEAIVKEAKEKTSAEFDARLSKAKRIKGIRSNRAKEKVFNNEGNYDKEVSMRKQEDISKKPADVENEAYLEEDIEFIKRLQREVLNNGEFNTD